MNEILPWVGFNTFVIVMLAVDLGVFHRRPHEISMSEAAIWTGVWITLAVGFGFGILAVQGRGAALQYFTGYLIEKSLSVDNMFVFVLIFSYFQVPSRLQHRVLYWGVLGALVMRGAMIAAGAYLIHRFDWVLYVFGGFLVVTGIRLAVREPEVHPERNPVVRFLDTVLPLTEEYQGKHFIVKPENDSDTWFGYAATPLLIVLVTVELTDLIFAVDSIPAIFGITRDVFIVYTSNVFAILGLRALYFLLKGVVDRFHYLRYGLAAVLSFVGVKMLLEDLVEIPVWMSLGVVILLVGSSMLFSLASAGSEGGARPGDGHV